jgi:DNA-binding FadR family transcriptional regulator
MMIGPIERKRYPEQIAARVQEKILKENLPNGYCLPTERQFAQELGVSRAVVREALRILDTSGFITIKKGPRGGVFVNHAQHKALSRSLDQMASCGIVTVDHLFDVRLQIEPFIGAEATRHATDGDLASLSALMADAARHCDDPAYLKQTNIEFHLLLGRISGNPVLSLVMQSITDILLKIAYHFLDPSFEKEIFKVHSDIAEMIGKGKPEEVRRMIKKDILLVKKNLKRCVEKGE